MSTPRRDFVRLSILGGASVSVLGCASAPKGVATPSEAGLELTLVQNPSLAEPGGQVSITHDDGRILIVRGDGDAIMAVSQRCPHRGCSVAWKTEAQGFVCPCHGSAFERDGALRKGPAKEGLRSYGARLDGDRVLVELA